VRALATFAVLVAIGVVAAPAPAAWREQRLTTGPTLGIDLPALATNERGDTAVAWGEGARTFMAVRRARAARFGRRIALRPDATPYVVVLSDGTVLVATLRNDGTEGGRRPCCPAAYIQRLAPGSRRLSAPRLATVRGSPLSGFTVSFVAGPGGRAALIGDADGILVVTSRARGIFGLPASPSSGRFGSRPFVGFGGDGRGAALWVEGSNYEQRLRGAPIARDGRVGAARTYVDTVDPRAGFDFSEFDADLDDDSRLTALWVSSGLLAAPATVTVATGSAAGPLGERQVLDTNQGLGQGVNGPDLDVAPNGRAIAAWRRFHNPDQTQVAIRARAGERFRVLPPFANNGAEPHVAVLAGGPAIVVSAQPASAVIVRPDGRIGSPRALRDAPRSGAVAIVGAAGRITVAWGTSRGLRVATYTAR
jgi:hypothetical protein